MKLRHLSLAVFVALVVAFTGPAVLHADTIYYEQKGVSGIQSISGTIVQETDSRVEITTADGRNVSIAQDDVFQIIRDAPSAADGHDPDRILEDFPGASALASGATLDETYPNSASIYHYGFKGGVNIANVRADPQELEDGDSLRGYAFGFWWGRPLWRRVTLQVEGLFSMKGDSESAAGYTASTRLGYFDLPVLAKMGFLNDAPVQPSILVGPSVGVNFSAKSKLEVGGSEVDVNVKDQVSGLDLGFVVGGGLDFKLGGGAFGVDLRYSRSLTDIGDGAAGSARNEVIAVLGSIALR